MKSKILIVVPFVLILFLSACSQFQIPGVRGIQPTPIVEEVSVTGYQNITIDQVEAEVGVGSPIPVHVIVSGDLPDICSQVKQTEVKQDGSNFIISLYATAEEEGCLKDTLPFKMGIPLNVIDLPAGSYTVTVNGSRADFELAAGNQVSPPPTADTPIVKDDIQVDSVVVDIGRGSPLPVHAVVSGNLPNTCAQLGEVRLHRDGTNFFVRLVADVPQQAGCTEERIPFQVEVPLSIVNLPEGPYNINVNGATTTFDPRAVPAPASEAESVEAQDLIAVEHVGIQIGEDTPIQADIVASGAWPGPCAQIAEVQSRMDGFQIDITVLTKTVETCRPDQMDLPFRFAFPLNFAQLPAGEYTITVNGTSTTLQLPPSP